LIGADDPPSAAVNTATLGVANSGVVVALRAASGSQNRRYIGRGGRLIMEIKREALDELVLVV
jgi:hypothetical protein